MHRIESRIGVGALAIVVIPAAFGALIALAGLYQALVQYVPWRWAMPFATVMLAICVGVVVVLSIRLSKLHGVPCGLGYGAAVLCTVLGGSYAWAYVLASNPGGGGGGFWTFVSHRLSNGLRVHGQISDPGGFRVSGWVLVLVWLAEAFVLFAAVVFTAMLESTRPFCDRCWAWVNRRKWKFGVRGQPPSREAAHMIDDILVHGPRATAGERLEYVLETCKCGRSATVAIFVRKPGSEGEESEEEVFSPTGVSVAELERLREWAVEIDPMASASWPNLTPTSTGPRPRADRAPFVLPEPKLDAHGEYVTLGTWMAYLTANESDNNRTRALRARLKAGDWPALGEALAATADESDRAHMIDAAASWFDPPRWLVKWVESEPESHLANLVRGVNCAKWAWVARGADWTPKNFGTFQSRLMDAEGWLQKAVSLNATDPHAWSWLVWCAIGLQLPEEEAVRRAKEAITRARSSRQPYSILLQKLASKWGGSEERMFEFARKSVARAAPGSTVHTLIVEAHLEAAATAARERGDSDFKPYFANAKVKEEIVGAARRCFQPGAYRPNMDSPWARQYFAFALWQAGAKVEAAEQLRVIGKSVALGPFRPAYFLTSPFTLAKARKECGV